MCGCERSANVHNYERSPVVRRWFAERPPNDRRTTAERSPNDRRTTAERPPNDRRTFGERPANKKGAKIYEGLRRSTKVYERLRTSTNVRGETPMKVQHSMYSIGGAMENMYSILDEITTKRLFPSKWLRLEPKNQCLDPRSQVHDPEVPLKTLIFKERIKQVFNSNELHCSIFILYQKFF
jgi:hypothetical protein